MLADLTISTEMMVVVSGVVVALVGGISFLFTMLMTNRSSELAATKEHFEKELANLKSDRDSWREMAEELGVNIEKAVNRHRAAKGLEPFVAMEPIVPEHSSPVSAQQQQTADIGTMRARLVAATKELGLEPRESAPPVAEEKKE